MTAATTTTTTTNYQSFASSGTNPNDHHHPSSSDTANKRGFSTSISDLFRHTQYERVDCCSMTLCGLLQSDRDRYLLTGVTPPSPCKRLTVHVLLPVFLFLTAGLGAIHIQDPVLNQIVPTSLVLMICVYFMAQCAKGSHKRTEIRKDLLFAKHQIMEQQRMILMQEQQQQQQNNNNNNNPLGSHSAGEEDRLLIWQQERPLEEPDNAPYFRGQSSWDFRCAHPCWLIGCYRTDDEDENHINNASNNHQQRPEEVSSLLLPTNSKVSVCRWIYLWLFPSPLAGYHLQCCGACALAQEGRELETYMLPPTYTKIDYITMQRFSEYALTKDLSKLSRRLLGWMAMFVGLAGAWSILSPYYWKHVVVENRANHHVFGVADFGIFVLVILESVLLLVVLAKIINNPKPSALSTDALIKFFASGFILSTSLAVFWELVVSMVLQTVVALSLSLAGVSAVENPETNLQQRQHDAIISRAWNPLHWQASSATDFLQTAGRKHPFLYTLYIMFSTFLMAAFIEEMCKYFGYRMCEHPDLLSAQELEECCASHPEDDDDEDDDDDADEESDRSKPTARKQPPRDFSQHRQSAQAHGAAITLAMVTVAMGFTCFENLVYVFVYGGTTVQMEASILLARSLFPVHPLSAALQAVSVVRRDVEHDRTVGLGRHILGPAVLFHGLYDFFIVWIDFIGHGKWTTLESVASVVCLLGALYYVAVVQYPAQRARLIQMDQKATVDQSRLI